MVVCCMLQKVYYYSINCLHGELPSASHRVRHTRAAVAAHRYELDVLRSRTSQLSKCFLPVYVRGGNGLSDAVVESGPLSGFKGAVNNCCFPHIFFYFLR